MRHIRFVPLALLLLLALPAVASASYWQRYEFDLGGALGASHVATGHPPNSGGCDRPDAPYHREWQAYMAFGASFTAELHLGHGAVRVRHVAARRYPFVPGEQFGRYQTLGYAYEGDPLCRFVRWPVSGLDGCIGEIDFQGAPRLSVKAVRGRRLLLTVQAWRDAQLVDNCTDELGRMVSGHGEGVDAVLRSGIGGVALLVSPRRLATLSTGVPRLLDDERALRPRELPPTCAPEDETGTCDNPDWGVEQTLYVTLTRGTLDASFGPPHHALRPPAVGQPAPTGAQPPA